MLTRLGLAAFFTMNVMAFTMVLWTADVYRVERGNASHLMELFDSLFRLLVMLFAMPVLYLLGWPLWQNARDSLRRGVFSTDLLLAAGVAAAYFYSCVSVIRGAGHVYFEVGCVVLVVLTLGRWLEATGKMKASEALDRLERLMPDQVRRLHDGQEDSIALHEVTPGDVLRVLAGERIPADGQIANGSAFVDEHVLTGESRPVVRNSGDPVLGGTLNLDGTLLIKVGPHGVAGTLSRLIEAVRQARLAKSSYERLADRASTLFVPLVAVIAIATFGVHAWLHGWETGMLQGLAVVLIACPCALGLATPLAVWSALGKAAEHGVLFRSGEALERLAQVRAVRFDKTGTLTTGEPRVASFTVDPRSDRAAVLASAKTLAKASTHVFSQAIAHFEADNAGNTVTLAKASTHVFSQAIAHFEASNARNTFAIATEVHTLAGRGVSAMLDYKRNESHAFLGSQRLIAESGVTISPSLLDTSNREAAAGRSMVWIGFDGRAQGLFAFEEQLRPQVGEAITECRALGLDVAILTGDNKSRANALAQELRLPVEAELLPEQKVAAIQKAKEKFGPVAMVGDGVNDAPALAACELGVGLGCGTDLARDTAAICLLSNDLTKLPWAISLARATVAIIRGNLAWAFGYNSIGVALAAFGWLNPSIAAVLMIGSSAFVVLNSLRLRRFSSTSQRVDTAEFTEMAHETLPPRLATEVAA